MRLRVVAVMVVRAPAGAAAPRWARVVVVGSVVVVVVDVVVVVRRSTRSSQGGNVPLGRGRANRGPRRPPRASWSHVVEVVDA